MNEIFLPQILGYLTQDVVFWRKKFGGKDYSQALPFSEFTPYIRINLKKQQDQWIRFLGLQVAGNRNFIGRSSRSSSMTTYMIYSGCFRWSNFLGTASWFDNVIRMVFEHLLGHTIQLKWIVIILKRFYQCFPLRVRHKMTYSARFLCFAQ